MEERQGMIENSKKQEQLPERKKFGGKLTEKEESIELFKNVFDDLEIEDVEIEMREGCVEEVDESDEIEIMR